ncbi:unnamed protein product, partial [marine sediment metagenome]
DDNILADKRRAKELFRALKELNILWASQASINSGNDEELLRLASESGCRGLFVGIESLSPASLKEMKKDRVNKPKDYMRLIENFRRNNIRLLGAFVFGFDADDIHVFQKTVQFAVNAKLDMAQFCVLTPYPGTAVYDKFKKEGRLLHTNWEHYYGGEVVFQPHLMSAAQLHQSTQWAWRKFYSINSKFKRLLRYGKYAPIYWMANNVFGNFNLSNVSRTTEIVKRVWQFVDGKRFRLNDQDNVKGAEAKVETEAEAKA